MLPACVTRDLEGNSREWREPPFYYWGGRGGVVCAHFGFSVMMVAGLAGQLCRGDTEQWFFFAPRQEREARGGRPNRTTASGYWKATGSPGYVYSSDNKVIGVKKTMVFYKGKSPTGRKTKWKMNEYRAIQEEANPSNIAIPKVCSSCFCPLNDAE